MGDVVLREAVQEELAKGNKRLILDLHGVHSIDSSVVGELAAAFTAVTRAGGSIKLAGLPSKVEDIAKIMSLDAVLGIYDQVGTALAAVKAET